MPADESTLKRDSSRRRMAPAFVIYYAQKNDDFQLFAETPADLLLSHGYTGAHIGLYTTSNGQISSGYADFDRVEYTSVKK